MVELLPPLLWLSDMHGLPANHCVDGCMILHYAYEQLGIIAQPRAVDLVVSDQRTDKQTFYGRPDPSWDGDTFRGHCILWLPHSSRIVDATVEQYPDVRRYRSDVGTETRVVFPADETLGGGELPVLVFEPHRAVGMRTSDGITREAQAEGTIGTGFVRFLPDLTHPLPYLPTWSVRRNGDGVELWDQGGVWARARMDVDDGWLADGRHRQPHSASHLRCPDRVRLPNGLSPTDYTPEQHAAELLASRRSGIVAAAWIPWTSYRSTAGCSGERWPTT